MHSIWYSCYQLTEHIEVMYNTIIYFANAEAYITQKGVYHMCRWFPSTWFQELSVKWSTRCLHVPPDYLA
jgi:hypothetical protein